MLSVVCLCCAVVVLSRRLFVLASITSIIPYSAYIFDRAKKKEKKH